MKRSIAIAFSEAQQADGSVVGSTRYRLPGDFSSPHDRLPDSAQKIVRRLTDQRDELQAAYHGLAERWEEERQERSRAQSDLQILVEPYAASSFRGAKPMEEGPTVVAARAKLARATEKVSRTTQMRDALGARAGRLRSILEAVDKWLAKIPADVAIESIAPGRKSKKTDEDIVAAVEAVRTERETALADLRMIERAPIPSAMAREIIRAEIEELAEKGRPELFGTIEHRERVRWPVAGINVRTVAEEFRPVHGSAFDALAFIAWMNKDALLARLDEELMLRSDDKNALTDEERARRERELRDRILDLERTEVELVDRAEDDVMHRHDVDPRALLRLSSKLPAPIVSD